jgi:hypothetical protein
MKKLLLLSIFLNANFSFSQGLTARDMPSVKTACQAARLISSTPKLDTASCAIVSAGLVCCCVGGSLGYCAKEGCPIAFIALVAVLRDNDGNAKKENLTPTMKRD